MKFGAIVQARMTSERFPGKVLYEVGGKPMLQYLLERLEHCGGLDGIVVATSAEASDDPLAAFCRRYGVAGYRGDLEDVASRFNDVVREYHFNAFVRINGDSPLLDQRLIEKGLKIFRGGDYDLVTNVMPRTYPRGQSVEVLLADTYRDACVRMREAADREHITRYYYRHPGDFRIRNFSSRRDLSGITLCVDTPEDMDNFAAAVARLNRPHWEYRLGDILRIYRRLP
ncbi:MAG TPA: NTP transferase domain-containing protein [Dehalococcoidales bacterium]|nr:MAG: hypothetical protein A2Z05_07390 [Chloroflexi bacterium RBG_16_60_22]HJX13219.1 NTP transferase domain-containing protein [Dehalococcoidales bacterium]